MGIKSGSSAGSPSPLIAPLLETALPEAEEEIGLHTADTQLVAELDPIEAHTTGFRVFPFLARVPPTARWHARPGEIAGVATPRVDAILDPRRRRRELLSFPTWPQPRMTECVAIDGHLLWGLTLRLLDAVLPRLTAGEWEI